MPENTEATATPSPSVKPPIAIIRDALRWAMITGLRVIPYVEDEGVVRTSPGSRNNWIRAGRLGDVSAVGALLLMHDPEPREVPFAASSCLGMGVAWVHGCIAGCADFMLESEWTQGSTQVQYLAGYDVGQEIRRDLIGSRAA